MKILYVIGIICIAIGALLFLKDYGIINGAAAFLFALLLALPLVIFSLAGLRTVPRS